MMKWETKKLEDVADFYLGKMLDKKKNKGDYRPYLANVNVRWGEFKLDDLREMRFEDHEKKRYGLEYGDIVMCEGGEPGRCAIWKNQTSGMMFQKALHRIRPHGNLDYRFLYYSFLSRGQEGGFDQYCTGATIKHLPRQNLAKVEVAVPPLEIQESIAAILSAYDDLIENNTHRIEILEEMARRLYEEWFVHFRFPGHEEVSFKESELGRIPEGWERKALYEVLRFDKGVSYKGKFLSEQGKVLINLKNFDRNGGFRRDGIKFYSGDHKDRHVVSPGELVVANTDLTQKGEVIGSPATVPRTLPSDEVIFSHHVFAVRPAKSYQIAKGFLYYFLAHGGFKKFAQGAASGTTVLGLRKDTAEAFECHMPPISLIRIFEEKVRPILVMIENLAEKNANLRAQRDLLLPKLISGEIDVADIPMSDDKEVEAA